MVCLIKGEMSDANSGWWKNGGEKVAHSSFPRAFKLSLKVLVWK